MATQYTAGLSAGQILTAATMNQLGAASETFTPTWTSTGTAPAIGNGSLTGKYFRINKLVVAFIQWSAGSTTTFGTGNYRLSLPITAVNTTGYVGTGTYGDASTFNAYVLMAAFITTTTVQFSWNVGGLNGVWGQANPVAMAQNDSVNVTLIYEAA